MTKTGSQLIEIAAVLYNLEHKSILQSFASLLPCDTNPVERINNIKAEATRCAYPFSGAFATTNKEQIEAAWNNPEECSTLVYIETISLNAILIEMSKAAQVCVAHNAVFDKKFIATLPCGDALLSKRWICTRNDFRWPVHLTSRKLESICEAMNVPYLNAHRALADCLLLAQCFERVEDLVQRFNY